MTYPWNGLGNLLLQQHFKRYDEAAAAFRQAIQLEKQDQTLSYLCLAELGLIADQNNWLEEGLAGARRTVNTIEYPPQAIGLKYSAKTCFFSIFRKKPVLNLIDFFSFL
jgi:hypothetical protein